MNRVEICNRALGVIGHDRVISSFDEQSSEGRRCRLFFEPSLNKVLSSHDWNFCAVERSYFVSVSDGYGVMPRPADCAKLVSVCEGGTRKPLRVSIANKMIRIEGGSGDVDIRYVSNDVLENTVYDIPPSFEEAVVYELATELSGPMLGDMGKTQALTQLALLKLSDAMSKDSDETAYRGQPDNEFLQARI